MNRILIEIKNLEYRSYNSSFVMKIDHFNLNSGKSLLISGESGSGKTTFLNLLSGTILAQKGEIIILGKSLSEFSSIKKDKIRGDNFGIIFQTFNLLPYLSVEENVLLGLSFSQVRKSRLKGSYKEEIEIFSLGTPTKIVFPSCGVSSYACSIILALPVVSKIISGP